MTGTQPRLRKVQELGLEVSPGQRCPYCRADVESGQWLVGCPCCQTVLHALCAADGRCTTLGCQLGPAASQAACALPRSRPPRRWAFEQRQTRRPWRLRWRRLALCALLLGAGVGFARFQATAPPPTPTWPPVRLPAPAVVVSDLRLPTQVQGDVVFVRGTIPPAAGTVDVVIRSPSGEVTLAAQPPGPFLGAVSLPGPGVHEVVVELTDAAGRRQVLSEQVRGFAPARR